MRRSFLGRVIPATLTTVGVAIPSTTAALVMLHAMTSGTSTQSTFSVSSSSGASTSSTPANTPTIATPKPRSTAIAKPRPAAITTPKPTAVSTRTISGPVVSEQYGQVQATVTVTGKKITNVSITAPEDSPRSAGINQQAVPLLRSETLQAQSANVNLISGATFTSEAYIQSLQGALQTAGL